MSKSMIPRGHRLRRVETAAVLLMTLPLARIARAGEVAGRTAAVETPLVREGEVAPRERVIIPTSPPPASVTWGPPNVASPLVAPPPAVQATGEGKAPTSEARPVATAEGGSSTFGKRRIVALALGGAGVIGLGLGTAFGLQANLEWGRAK